MSKLSRKRARQQAVSRYQLTTTEIASPQTTWEKGQRVRIKRVGRHQLAPGLPGSEAKIIAGPFRTFSNDSYQVVVRKDWRDLKMTLDASMLEAVSIASSGHANGYDLAVSIDDGRGFRGKVDYLGSLS